jgi:hypothetical protein
MRARGWVERMNEQQASIPPLGEPQQPVSLKMFFALGVLWLPLSFFLWFTLRSLITWPVTRLGHQAIEWWLPGVVHAWKQNYHYFQVTAIVPPPPGLPIEPGQLAAFDANINVLLYTYGVAVLWGLIMATPDDERSFARRLLICVVGWIMLIPFHVFSVAVDLGKQLFIDLGPAGLQLAQVHGVNLELVALFFQFCRLVLPTLGALIVWALFNRRFIEQVRDALPLEPEPGPGQDGPTQSPPPSSP